MNQDPKKVLFLFGAGASVSAGCDSVAKFTQWLLDQFHANPLLVPHRNWLVSLWEFIENTSWGFAPKEIRDQMPHLKQFEPNFEHLVTAIEALQEYIHSGAAASMPGPEPNILEKLGFRHISNEPMLGFLVGRLLEEKKFSEATWQFVSLVSTLSFIGARNSIVKLICDHFPENYELDDLADFVDCLRDEALQITVATTNYDLVLEALFERNSVEYRDGFVDSETLSRWVGLDYKEGRITYLKLHGSSNWYHIPNDWFAFPLKEFSRGQIYKFTGANVLELFRSELLRKDEAEKSQQFGVPHLVMGGFKDRKLFDSPFIEISTKWMTALSQAHIVVVVGHSGSDTHLMKQVKGLLSTNNNVEKVIVIDPSAKTHETFGLYLQAALPSGGQGMIFLIVAPWNLASLRATLGITLQEMLHMSAVDLKETFIQANRKTQSQVNTKPQPNKGNSADA